MAQQVFINLPVKDLECSKAFYTALGFTINPQFTNEYAACVVISDTIYEMLLTHDFFQRFTGKEIADAHQTTEVLNCLSAENKESVDAFLSNATAGGGQASRPAKDEGFMYGGAVEDPDGHIWEVMWMDMSAHQAPKPEAETTVGG